MGKIIDLTGKQFGRLTVTGIAENQKYPNGTPYVAWHCRCDCGGTKVVNGASLRSGATRSCGCLSKENPPPLRRIHNAYKTPEYGSWRGMIDRCYCEGMEAYSLYGGRGISVCERWRDSFQNFLEDMGHKPAPGHSLDRIDPNGDYEPQNCRWASPSLQSFNRRRLPSKTGITGVVRTANGNWQARIKFQSRTRILGTHESLFEAVAARKSAEVSLLKEIENEH